MSQSDQLSIPDMAKNDSKSFEVLRVWVANDNQHVNLRFNTWNDPAAWGLLFVDLARHVANAYKDDAGIDPLETLRRIKAGWDAEWTSPTDDPSGKILP